MRDFRKDPVPVNTTKEMKKDPTSFLVLASIVGGSNAIELQEKQGQGSFVKSETLPDDLGGPKNKKALEACGVKFLGPVDGDDMFQRVELPAGWKKVPADHSMWSYLVDEKGRRRASIFYKAASYNRRSHLGLNCRFSWGMDYDRREKGEYVAVVKNLEEVVYQTSPIPIPEDREERWRVSDAIEKEAKDWLLQRYPDYQNPAAYWEG